RCPRMVEGAGPWIPNSHQCNPACVQRCVSLTTRSTGPAGTGLLLGERRWRRAVNLVLLGHDCARFASVVGHWYSAWMKVAEVLRMLHDDGWLLVATRGSH